MFEKARRSLRVLTRPLADVSAPKHTAVSPPHLVNGGLFYVPEAYILYKDRNIS
jgi:hypothetical protein